jgi:LytTr DNA-binding domain
MNQQLHYQLLYYALIVMAISSIFYLLSAFGLFELYPHFFGKTHPHKWHTLFRLCFVIAFAVVNHWVLVPHFYIKRQYVFFFSIVLLCLVSLLVLPDIILKAPDFEPPNHEDSKLGSPNFEEGHRPPFLQTLLVELVHMYLLFFICTFTSIAVRTRQYMQQIEEQQANAIANIKYKMEQEPLVATEYIEDKQAETVQNKIETALTVTVNYSLVRIEFSEILFIKSMDNYLHFHLKDKKSILVRMTLRETSEKLPSEAFLRIHKSYIVSIAAIESIRNKTISIANQDIPIGKSYEEVISKVFVK